MTPRGFRSASLALLGLALGAPAAAQQAAGAQVHVVKRGDTLWDIARTYLNDPVLWPAIYKLNTDRVADPHWIYPGQELRLSGAAAAVAPTDTPAPGEAASTRDAAIAPDTGTVEVAGAPLDDAMPAGRFDDEDGLFPKAGAVRAQDQVVGVDRLPYRALRPNEFHRAPFLTEGRALPFGAVLGRSARNAIPTSEAGLKPVFTGEELALRAPAGARYQVGDTLVTLIDGGRTRDFGAIMEPSGLVRVTRVEGALTFATVLATFGPIREGQRALPAEKFTGGGRQRALPVADGMRASVIMPAARQELTGPTDVVFIDKGRRDGVRPGDIFEARLPAEERAAGARGAEVMASMQVVRTGERTASVVVLNVRNPLIEPGTPLRQVARLPN